MTRETLTYLHGTISTRRHAVAVPDTPMYLDARPGRRAACAAASSRCWATQHLRTLTILGFPNLTRPGILDALNHLGFPYRWVDPLHRARQDRGDQGAHQASAGNGSPSASRSPRCCARCSTTSRCQLLDSDADNKVVDADSALQALGGDHVAFGYLTTTVTVSDTTDRARRGEGPRRRARRSTALGFTTIRESINAVEAWLGSPARATSTPMSASRSSTPSTSPISCRCRRSGRARHATSISTARRCFYAETSGSTPFRFSTHVGDVGHMLIVGPTGAGKSVLLALLALQFRRYPDAQVYIFDKGNSARAAVLAMGGAHHVLGSDGSLAFQPLQRHRRCRPSGAGRPSGSRRCSRTRRSPSRRRSRRRSGRRSAALPPRRRSERTLTGLSVLLQSNALKAALHALHARRSLRPAARRRRGPVSRSPTSSASRPRR